MATPLSSDTGNTDEGSLSTAAEKAFGLLADDPEFRDTESDESPESDESEEEESREEPDEEEDSEDDSDLEDEEDEDDAEDEDLDDEEPEPARKKAKAKGEDEEVTEEEAERGYLRQQDYSRKTQALAEERKAFNQEQESLRAERAEYRQRLELVNTALKQGMAQEPDWAALKREDPVKYAELREAYQDRKEQLEAVEAEQKRVAEQEANEAKALRDRHLAAERERLVEAIPEWLDEDKAKDENLRLADYALASGFTQEDLDNLTDHRAVVILRKAMLYDSGRKGSDEVLRKTRKKSKTLEPGSSKANQPRVGKKQKKLEGAQKRLAKSGKVRDAAAAFFEILDD